MLGTISRHTQACVHELHLDHYIYLVLALMLRVWVHPT
jgi:hypothetical protein